MQVIKSLDELVTEIEDNTAHTPKEPLHVVQSTLTASHDTHQASHQQEQEQQSQLPVVDVVAKLSRQLSERFDLHDAFPGVFGT